MNSKEANLQREQLQKYLNWVDAEGNSELPTQFDTLFKPHQIFRMEWLRRHCTGTVMELGCCYGYILAYCSGQIGVDWNENSISLAKILNPSREFTCSDIRQVPYSDKCVDTVIIPDVLEHLPWEDFFTVIDEARRLARKRVLVTLPYYLADIESTCFKHQWLVTTDKIATIQKGLGKDIILIEKKQGFVLIRIKS